ncbi:MAG TPA: DNA polymerase IV [Candidatus Thermoplasmatota archaeon]|nr:DNA polymerase IV [Candidatus Thermoplasmatota archaeon]
MGGDRLEAVSGRGASEAAPRIVFHVDLDAFYASVEVRDDPSLKGRPLVIGADPRAGKGRGVVCTASYEARKFGIRSAMPISQAWRLAPHATYIRPDFSKYGPASEAVMQVLERYADVLEQVGLDEAYLDVTQRTGGDWDLARSLALSLQAAVNRETGLSCSVGVAPCKAVAKVATDQRKPHGVTLVRPDRVQAFLAPLPVRVLNGCGPKTAQALRDEGLLTVGDLAGESRESMEQRFGSHGAWLWRIAHGDDPRGVEGTHGLRKSRGNETTFFTDLKDPEKVLRAASELLEETLDLHDRRDRRAFSTLTVKVRYAGFVTLTRARTVEVPFETERSDTVARAWATAKALFLPLLDGRPVRLVGVRLSGFAEPTGQQALDTFGARLPELAAKPVVALRPAKP